ncbi:dihydrolipoyllysine-residue succinyltransferase [Enterobacteriaceae endosymbiont of Donacia provostii]|uniref:dihydrolipoyllysine-residue succinyltransferase n=1 Tax=Enterobacteriaceae endosymbiont of Donacia provostii TaxID=2675781 RepID=UPI001449DA5D|nr:dihydrolipoyllysine-residue succinyltransferase [Enterobacteriaceae endosymbiont of Donacia provostii]QJC33683.1 dihydrolipoyllysine-residue succinyltransferase [Enterobacteriaceae endosymbiont of Donacia provostii]
MNNINIIVPELPESVNNAIIIQWYKKPGEIVNIDDILLELETDKIVLEIPSTVNGILKKILVKKGERVQSQQIIGILKINKDLDNNKIENKDLDNNKIENKDLDNNKIENKDLDNNKIENKDLDNNKIENKDLDNNKIENKDLDNNKIENKDLDNNKIENKDLDNNKIENKDFQIFSFNKLNNYSPSIRRKIKKNNYELNNSINFQNILKKKKNSFKIKKMSPLRKYLANKLMDSKKNTVMLTTFNEVNMKKIINIKNDYKDFIFKKYNLKLGFTSFNIKAVTKALKFFKKINAFIDKDNIIYNNKYHINIAIATKRGLITPIIYNTDQLSIINIEKKIKELVQKSNNNQLSLKDLQSGTFTITNGGVFGSLMSTPIINPPQSAILGMHTIKERPIVINHKICIMPMMYLALSYDHRLIDGKDAIGFLMLVKNFLEDPICLFL